MYVDCSDIKDVVDFQVSLLTYPDFYYPELSLNETKGESLKVAVYLIGGLFTYLVACLFY